MKVGRSRFWLSLVLVIALGLAVRLIFVVTVHWDDAELGDASWYHGVANLIAQGHWFVSPFAFRASGALVPVAEHPPLFPILLSGFSALGVDSWRGHEVATAVFGAAGVGMIGVAGRAWFGERVGLIAAVIAAVYPYLWVNDGLILSESIAPFTTAFAIYCAALCCKRGRRIDFAILGFAGGLIALSRAELVLAIPLFGLAGAVKTDGTWLRKLGLISMVGLVGLAMLLPWTLFNRDRFEKPVLLSTGSGITMAVSTCDYTFYGRWIGSWAMSCLEGKQPPADQSVADGWWRGQAMDYFSSHKTRVPVVFAARVGRTWGVFRPIDSLLLDFIEGRPMRVSRVGLWSYYLLVPLAFTGLVIARRRGVPTVVFWAVPATVTLAALMTFGNTRYRVPAEVPMVLLASLSLETLGSAWAKLGKARSTSRDFEWAPGQSSPDKS